MLLQSLEKSARNARWSEKKTNKKTIERFSKAKIILRITMESKHSRAYVICRRSIEWLCIWKQIHINLDKIPFYHPHIVKANHITSILRIKKSSKPLLLSIAQFVLFWENSLRLLLLRYSCNTYKYRLYILNFSIISQKKDSPDNRNPPFCAHIFHNDIVIMLAFYM